MTVLTDNQVGEIEKATESVPEHCHLSTYGQDRFGKLVYAVISEIGQQRLRLDSRSVVLPQEVIQAFLKVTQPTNSSFLTVVILWLKESFSHLKRIIEKTGTKVIRGIQLNVIGHFYSFSYNSTILFTLSNSIQPWKVKNPYLTSVIDNSFDIYGKKRFVFTTKIKNHHNHILQPQPVVAGQPQVLPTRPLPTTTPLVTIGQEEEVELLPHTTLLPPISVIETTLPPLVDEAGDNLVISMFSNIVFKG